MLKILVLTKRQYTNKDLLDDRYGRLRELPYQMGLRGHNVYGLCLSYCKKEEGVITDGEVRWESINASISKLPGLLRFIKRAEQIAQRADVIWACSDSFYAIIGYCLSLKYRIPVVCDLYDNFEYFLMARLPIIKQLYRLAVRRCDAVTCVSNPLAKLVHSYGRSDYVFVLENAVREDLFVPANKEMCRKTLVLPRDIRIVGTAGALGYERGTQALLQAFQLLKQKHLDLHLVLAGPRNIRIPFDNRVHDLGILPLEKVPILLNALDITIICNQENEFGRYCFPQKAREIMACDIPLIAARVGSMAELLKDHSEWLFNPDDASNMARVLENRLEDRRTGYKKVLSWSDVAAELEKIFINLCKDQSLS